MDAVKPLKKFFSYQEFPGDPVFRLSTFTAVAWVQSLIRELRPLKPHGAAKKRKKEILQLSRRVIMVVEIQAKEQRGG